MTLYSAASLTNPVLSATGLQDNNFEASFKLNNLPSTIVKHLKPSTLDIIKILPLDGETDTFIWFDVDSKIDVLAVYLEYGVEPNIETLSFREKISLPTSAFENEFSATICSD